MNPCECGHVEHGARMSRSNPPRVVAQSCLTFDCRCENFRAVEGQKCSNIETDVEKRIRNLERQMRQFQLQLQELKKQAKVA